MTLRDPPAPTPLAVNDRVRTVDGEVGTIRAIDGDDALVRLDGADRSGGWMVEELERVS